MHDAQEALGPLTSPLYVALVHHPVRDRAGDTITTAVTNLDVHDIARSCRTYGVSRYYIVTPIDAQKALVGRILGHWSEGAGRDRVPERSEALSRVRVVSALEDAVADAESQGAGRPRTVVTGARAPEGMAILSYPEARIDLRERQTPTMLVLGTGHGLARDLVASADAVLAPIRPSSDYNHLSVRAAAAIILDRLVGEST